MRFFLTCLKLQLCIQLKKLPALMAMAAVMMLLSGLLAAGAALLLETERFSGVTVAVASEDDDPRLAPYLSLLGNMPELKAFGSIVNVPAAAAVRMITTSQEGIRYTMEERNRYPAARRISEPSPRTAACYISSGCFQTARCTGRSS